MMARDLPTFARGWWNHFVIVSNPLRSPAAMITHLRMGCEYVHKILESWAKET